MIAMALFQTLLAATSSSRSDDVTVFACFLLVSLTFWLPTFDFALLHFCTFAPLVVVVVVGGVWWLVVVGGGGCGGGCGLKQRKINQ